MIKKVLVFILCLITSSQYSQEIPPKKVEEVLEWNFEVKYSSRTAATIMIDVTQKNGWEIFGQIQPKGSFIMPASFNYNVNTSFELIGLTQEFGSRDTTLMDVPVNSFPGQKARFEQKIKILSKKNFNLTVRYDYTACGREACFPPIDGTKVIAIRGTEGS